MIKLFDRPYLAVSNLIVQTYEGLSYVFPSPLSVEATIENEDKNIKNQLIFRFSNYNESLLVLPYTFSLFMYLLTPLYTIDTMYFRVLKKITSAPEVNGYKGIYEFSNFNTDDLIINEGTEEIYDCFNKI